MKTKTAGLLILLFVFSLEAIAVLRLSWTLNTDDTIGYRIYRGPASNSLNWVLDVGNTNTLVISNLPPGVNAFVATAYDASGLESLPSLPAYWTNIQPASPKLHLQAISQ